MLNAKTDSIMQILYQIALGLRIMEDLEAILGASTIAIFLLARAKILYASASKTSVEIVICLLRV
mgnify:CR=1 FL=1